MKPQEEKYCKQLFENRFCKNDSHTDAFLEALEGLSSRKDPEILRMMLRSLTDKNDAEEVYANLINTCCEFKSDVLINTVIDEIISIKKNAPEYSEELLLQVFHTPGCISFFKKRFSKEEDKNLVIETISYIPRIMFPPLNQDDLDYYKKLIDSLIEYVPENAQKKIWSSFDKNYKEIQNNIKPDESLNKNNLDNHCVSIGQIDIFPYKGICQVLFNMKRSEARLLMPRDYSVNSTMDSYFNYQLTLYYSKDDLLDSVIINNRIKIPVVFNGKDVFKTDYKELVEHFNKYADCRLSKHSRLKNGTDLLYSRLGIILCASKENKVSMIEIHNEEKFKEFNSYHQ